MRNTQNANLTQFSFNLEARLPGTLARAGEIRTPHGPIKTPAFIVGATQAAVKALTTPQVNQLGGQAVLANTYHLMLRPGAGIIESAGGLGRFMGWRGPTVTDSGGFQVFSLGMAYKKGLDKTTHSEHGESGSAQHDARQLAKIDDDGVNFRSHLDGSLHRLTPEISMRLQWQIGADIHMAFDEALSPLAGEPYIRDSVDRTHRWAERCLAEHQRLWQEKQSAGSHYQALFGVVQGARIEELRRKSAEFINSLGFDGFGIGGVYQPEEIPNVLSWIIPLLQEAKPRHLLGIGSHISDLFLGVEYGADTFDCVAFTRQARNGSLYTHNGRINIKNACFRQDFSPPDPECDCYTCQNHTKAYLSHLFRAGEINACVLASLHNERFVVRLAERIRQSVLDGSFMKLKKTVLGKFGA